ncbi:hypothetical protein PG994_009525 [Apiospora phragmitis]|uniref:Amino acid permease/ SLC12A domain-containing protein n=1 Tax=Apiospora phragmitis TaxID=2905665 RepID=A0ABR1U6F1_9PEZI
MSSSGTDYAKKSPSPQQYATDRGNGSDAEKNEFGTPPARIPSASVGAALDQTHRKLKSRHIQLIGIGGTIGTALYVQIGRGLLQGGPASLFLAFTFWCSVILAVTLCMAEMVTYLPISSPFIRFAGRWVDEAFGFAAGWNFFVFEAALVPFEITACNVIIHFWSEAVPTAAIITIVIMLYALINVLAVKWYGESEFWAALGKVLLIIGLIVFTFIVMLGGNPQARSFWWNNPGSFNTFYQTGDLGRFMGFLQCLIQASFTIAGPDYVSMAAGEAENPRFVMPRAYNAVFYRLTTFFMLGSLCVGILVPYDDATMADAFEKDKPGAAASPYVIAMSRLGIPVLPTSSTPWCSRPPSRRATAMCTARRVRCSASRLRGKAPRFLTVCLRNGVPIYSVGVVLLISLLSFLQVSEGSATVLSWFVSLVTASQLINFSVMCVTYICFHRALRAQAIDRSSLPYRGFGQPYAAYYALVATFVMAWMGGYTVFLPGKWDVPSFLFSYMMLFICPVLYIGWKLIHKTKFVNPHEADLLQDLAGIEEYTKNFVVVPAK